MDDRTELVPQCKVKSSTKAILVQEANEGYRSLTAQIVKVLEEWAEARTQEKSERVAA